MAQAMAEDGGRVPMSPGLQATLLRAREYAASQSEAEVLLEHLLLALSEDADAANVLEACRIDLSRLRHDVAGYIGSLNDRVPPGTPGAPAISAALTQVLKYATLAAQQGRRTSIDGAIVLAALVGDGRSMAASFLKAQGLTFEAAIRALREVATRSGSAPTRQPVQRPTEPVPQPVQQVAPAPAPTPGQSRTEDILARARERVESRSPRSEPHGRSQRSEPHAAEPGPPLAGEPVSAIAAAESPPPTAPAATISEMARLPVPEAPQSPGFQPVAAAPAAAHAEPQAPVSRPAPPTPPMPGNFEPDRELRANDGPVLPASSQAPGASHFPEPPAPPSLAPPRPLPPNLPRTEPPRPAEMNGAALHPENRIAPRRPANPGPAAAQPAQPQPTAPPGAGWPARPSQPGAAQPRTGSEAEAAPQRASWPAANRPAWPEQSQQTPYPPGPAPSSPGGRAAPALPTIDATMVSHSIPTRMKKGRPHVIEVRVERPSLGAVGGPPRSYALRPEAIVARAIAVRLRPLAGRFIVDAGSPETQWEQGGPAGAGRLSSEAAVWRFTVTPLSSGRGVLQLSVSARTLGADGVLAETQLPEQGYEVRISHEYTSLLARVGVVGLVASASMFALKFVESLLRMDSSQLAKHFLGL